jgi:hypothetical protein
MNAWKKQKELSCCSVPAQHCWLLLGNCGDVAGSGIILSVENTGKTQEK